VIPKRIIQTGPPEVPLLLKSAVSGVQLLNPDFEYRFFDDTDIEAFVAQYFPDLKKIYYSFRYRIQRYDFFRYLCVYQLGGFYLDLDIFLARSLTPLLSAQCVFPFEELSGIIYLLDRYQMDWQIGNYAFGAAPRDPFLKAVIDNCVRAQQDESWVKPMMKGIPRPFWPQFYVLNTTGPGLVTRTFAEYSGRIADITILFPEDVRDPATWHHFGNFGVHHMMGSWRGSSGILKRRLLRLWDGWTLRRIIANSKNTGKTREIRNQVPLNIVEAT